MRLVIAAVLVGLLPFEALAEQSALRKLETGDDSKGWEAVGRLNLGKKGFCTGAMIAPNLVLTAAHCLFDKTSGERVPTADIQFLAGWRNGRAVAYRNARRAVAHPDYQFESADQMHRVAYDLALVELDQPIRLPSIKPFETDVHPAKGDEVGIVSYARDRSEAPSLQEVCEVLGRQPGVLVLSCNVDFGSSGAPIFSMRGGVARVVSVVSAKADMTGQQVALATTLEEPLEVLREALDNERAVFNKPMPTIVPKATTGGAKFVKP